jgi:hypothetical protein
MFRLLLALTLFAGPASAQDRVAMAGLPNPVVIGEASLGVIGITAYDARLSTSDGVPFDWTVPMALELDYKRGFSADDLLRGTEAEMRRTMGDSADMPNVIALLDDCFLAVEKGDSYLAVSLSPDQIDLWRNGTQTCTVNYPDIRKRFLSIWLSDQSRFSTLSRKLRGQ